MSHHEEMPEQETLRRRLRAAMLLCDLSLQELAGRIDPSEKLSARTLRKLTNAESEIRLRALRPIAEAMGIPIEWFTAASIWAPFQGAAATPEFEERLAAVERELQNLRSPHAPESASAPGPRRRAKRPAQGGSRQGDER